MGEDVVKGSFVFVKGSLLNVVSLLLLVLFGIVKVEVFKCIKVVIFFIGDELVSVGKLFFIG